MDIEAAKSDILATEDLLERALKLSGLADLRDFKILSEFRAMKNEVEGGNA